MSLYKPADLAEIKKRLASKDGRAGFSDKQESKLNFYKFPSGTERVVLRYLPSPSGVPGKIIKKHYNLPEIKDIICFRTHEMDCDLCNMLRDYEHKIDVSDWSASSRSYMNALILSDPTQSVDPKTPHIVGQGEGNLYWVYSKITDPDIGDICDPYLGFNVAYQRSEFNGKFDRTILPKPGPISQDKSEVETILSKIPDLDKIWKKPDDVFLKRLQDVTQKLRVLIEQRLVTLSKEENSAPAPQPVARSAPPVQQKVESPKVNKPPQAPECFADSKVFYRNESTGEEDPSKQKCISCPFDFHCGEEIKKRK